MKLIHKTKSLCPECKSLLDAYIYDKNGELIIVKKCKEHGRFEEKYFDAETYKRFKKYAYEGPGMLTINIDNSGENCPMDCGLCARHKSHTALANIVLTNRCHLNCFYCFFYARENDPIYEPSIERIKRMLEILRSQRPVPCNAVQYTGGEPLLREDIIDIIKLTKEMGFEHIQLNTTGMQLVGNQKLSDDLAAAGVTTYYLSFDGVSPQTNPKNHYEIPYILKVLRPVKENVVLVPTVINNFNDHEVGDIINFAFNNIDVIRSINFQPVSLVGRMPVIERKMQRITIPELLEKIEKQTNGIIKKKDFYPIPCIGSISEFIESITGYIQYHFSTHPVCGAGTYVFLDGDEIVPITNFVDVEGFFEYLKTLSNEISKSKFITKEIKKKKVIFDILLNLDRFIDKEKAPKTLKVDSIIKDALIYHNYESVGKFHTHSLFIGTMHFQDLYNYDVERVEKCCIHYVMPDDRIVPFCAFNVIPEIYRDKVQRKYSMTYKEWLRKSGKSLEEIKYKRDIDKLISGEEYRKVYSLKDYFGKEKEVAVEYEPQ